MNDDILIACVDLAGRAGATDIEIGHTGDDDTPAHQVRWYAVATYRGARLIADDHQSPTAAAMALLRVEGPRGDVAAMERALGNRAARRAAKRGRR
ncbi:hypothetical protein FJK98_02335 [Micromonospora sp. HM134]|uniref:hypothetical protein n=1 Tax=Micromonospora sp. HM134 TaxID=2583243 RepID=UPI001198555F|nr:hypothetical protein [Micromonospora sp. HM134]QDY06143.1 hypothetical protein FJK98_02335 [Micromonospora sp. HM134]